MKNFYYKYIVMKKVLLILVLVVLLCPTGYADEWDTFLENDRNWDGQKSITNKEFEEAINTMEGNKKKKEAKQKKRKIKKISGGGTSLHNELNPNNEILKQNEIKKPEEEDLILNVPVNMIIDGKLLDKGYYKVIGEKDNNGDIYLLFYQSQFFMGKVKAYETRDDYGQEKINFVEMIPEQNCYIKVIYGSLDFNAYTYIKYWEE